MLKVRLYQDGLIQVGRNVMEKYFDNYSWDVVGTQTHSKPINEEEESAMRSKAMLIIARKYGSSKVWKRIIKQFVICLNGSK